MRTSYSIVKKQLLPLMLLWFLPDTAVGQGLTPPPVYFENISVGDSLMEQKNYGEAAAHYTAAFKAFGGMGTPDDRYNAVRAWAYTGNIDSVNYFLNYLCANSHYWNDEKFSNDPAFTIIKNTPAFSAFISCARENKEKYAPAINLTLYNQLDTVFKVDQQYRMMAPMRDYSKHKNTVAMHKIIKDMEKADARNVAKVTTILDKYGWLSVEEVGLTGNTALFLVIQHAPYEVQEKYCPVLKKAVAEKKAHASQLALLEDRISVHQKGYQIYGSQLENDPVTNVLILSPIIDEANVNERRKNAGLEPLEEYLKRFHLTYTPKTK